MEVFYYSPPEASSAEPPSRREHRSAHFAFHLFWGSEAGQSIDLIASRVESTWQATVSSLDLDAAADTPIGIVPSELADVSGPDAVPGPPLSEARVIRSSYWADALGEGLERALVELVPTDAPTDSAA